MAEPPPALWRPPFVSRLAAEDRCHLNGVALEPLRVSLALTHTARPRRGASPAGFDVAPD